MNRRSSAKERQAGETASWVALWSLQDLVRSGKVDAPGQFDAGPVRATQELLRVAGLTDHPGVAEEFLPMDEMKEHYKSLLGSYDQLARSAATKPAAREDYAAPEEAENLKQALTTLRHLSSAAESHDPTNLTMVTQPPALAALNAPRNRPLVDEWDGGDTIFEEAHRTAELTALRERASRLVERATNLKVTEKKGIIDIEKLYEAVGELHSTVTYSTYRDYSRDVPNAKQLRKLRLAVGRAERDVNKAERLFGGAHRSRRLKAT